MSTQPAQPGPVRAIDFAVSARPVIDSAAMLAREVNSRLTSGQEVAIDFAGLRGVSSSFFNTLFQSIAQETGVEALDKIRLLTDTAAQLDIVTRSFKAVQTSMQPKGNGSQPRQ